MLLKHKIFYTLFFAYSFGFGQVQPTDTNANPYQYLLLDTTQKEEKPIYKPVIGIGRGVFTFFGDVKDNYNKNPLVGRHAIIGNVSRNINSFLELNFNIAYGKLTGNAHTPTNNINFLSEVLIGGVNLNYNFKHLIKKPSDAMPYISLGFESFEFNSKADMYDANGNLYNYWSDGTIRNVSETGNNELTSKIIQRDYKYETDLRELNLDGLGKYPQVAFAIPIDFGFKLKYSNRIYAKIGATYHFALNTNVDNVSYKGEGVRKGTKNDNFLLTYVTVHFDLFSPPKLSTLEQHYGDIEYASIDAEDEDGDGVVDLWDECPETPPGIEVNNKGCPLDNDNDGKPDYEDKEKESGKNAIVNLDGITYNDSLISKESAIPDAVPLNKLCEYYPSLCKDNSGVKQFKTMYFDIPDKFKPVDLNNDGYISIEELNIAVDKFFDMGTNYTIDDIYELNNFFFDQ